MAKCKQKYSKIVKVGKDKWKKFIIFNSEHKYLKTNVFRNIKSGRS